MFTDPIAQVIIENPTTGQEWNWTAPDFPFLTGASLIWEEGGFGIISITVDFPYEDGIAKVMTPPSPFAIQNRIRVRMGYAGGDFTDWAVGVLEAGGEGLSVDANGVSGSVNFAGVSRSVNYTVSKSIKTAANYAAVVEAIAESMGMEPNITPGALEVLKLQDNAAFNPSAWMGMSSMEILGKICRMSNLDWTQGPDMLDLDGGARFLTVYRPREGAVLTPPEAMNTYLMRGIIDVEKKQYPLLSWSPEGEGSHTWQEVPNAAAGGAGSSTLDTETGEVAWLEVLPEDVLEAIVGVWADSKPEDEELAGEGVKSNVSREGEDAAEILAQPVKPGVDGKAMAETHMGSAMIAGNPSQVGVISTIGVPSERNANYCRVAGMGPVYDGRYKIVKISHIWAPGSYDMSLTVNRFGTGGQDKSSGEQAETAGGQEQQ